MRHKSATIPSVLLVMFLVALSSCDDSGTPAERIRACKQILRKNPDDAVAHFNLGLTYGRLDRHKEALRAYKQAIRIDPENSGAYNNLGTIYGKLERHAEAVEAYKGAIRIKPDLVEAHFNLGLTYLELDDKGSALEQYKIVKELDKEKGDRLFNHIYK